MKKLLTHIAPIIILCSLFTSCSAAQTPDMLIRCSDSFGKEITYYSVSDNQLKEISENRYTTLTRGDDLKRIDEIGLYAFEVHTDGSDPAQWTYEQDISDPEVYDTDVLISELEYLEISYTGEFSVLIYEFDNYKAIYVSHFVISDMEWEGSNWLMCDEQIVENPDDIDLGLVREAYRLK